MQKFTALLLSFLFCLIAHAQKKQNVYFLKKNGTEVTLKDSADYIRIIEEPDSGENYFPIKEFYANGKRKLIGKVSSFNPNIIYEGTVITYYQNGIKESSINYTNNVKTGNAFYFFTDGRVKKHKDYSTSTNGTNESRLIYQIDTLGKVLVKDGTGYLIDTTNYKDKSIIEEGNYSNGFKEGEWKGRTVPEKSTFVENYSHGNLVSGTSIIGDNKYFYKTLMTPPEFKGGIQEFYNHIGKTVKLPADAIAKKIMGTVIVSFTVEVDGNIGDVKVDRSVYPSLDYEAINAVKSSPKWIPGKERGVPVRVRYVVPIKFNTQ